MKRIIVIVLVMLVGLMSQAQELKPTEGATESYIALLKQNGYQTYSLDISPFKNTTYNVLFEIREYVSNNSDPISVRFYGHGFTNRTMVNDFMWAEISDAELAAIKAASIDYENGVFSCEENITIGFIPSANDSTKTGYLYVGNEQCTGFNMKLKPLEHNGALNDKVIYQYTCLPFKASEFKEGKFIPLAMCLSYWYDARFNIIRCCGESEIDPTMISDILEDTPHYYVIGVIFTR